MPIVQERMTSMLATVRFYREAVRTFQATLEQAIYQPLDPVAALEIFKMTFDLPDHLAENFQLEAAHFKVHGKRNLKRRKYTEKSKLNRAIERSLDGPLEAHNNALLSAWKASTKAAPAALGPDEEEEPTPSEIAAWEAVRGKKWPGQPCRCTRPFYQRSAGGQGPPSHSG